MNFYNSELFPPPSGAFEGFVKLINEGRLVKDVSSSLKRYGTGLAMGIVIGLLLGFLTGGSKTMAAVLKYPLHFLRAIPSVALIPLAILWFGIDDSQKIALVAWGTTFPVWLNAHTGVSEVEQEYIRVAQTLGASRWKMFTDVIIPRAIPYILTGARTSIATGFFALTAAEMAGAFEGLGFRILNSYDFFQTDKMMAGIVSIGILAVAIDAIFVWAARRMFPWWNEKLN